MKKNKNLSQLIVSFPSGDHSNRLFQNLHFEAFCKEHKIKFVNPSFESMHSLYVNSCAVTGGKIPFFNKCLDLLLKYKRLRLLCSVNVILFDEESPSHENILRETRAKCIFVGGWGFRIHSLTEKYQNYFIEKYTLKANLYVNNELFKLILHKRSDGFVIAGIHIRRGDYRVWQGGKFHFEDEVFLTAMRQFRSEVKKDSGKEVFFVIFSNEKNTIAESDNVIFSRNEWYIDQFLMSKCDFLIGPPSTFTLWSSYIGKIKYFHLDEKNKNITLNDFKYCRG